MLLREAIAKLSEWPKEATLFAERISGEFRPESEAAVIELSEDEIQRPIHEVAAAHAPGKEYFLEVFVAREVLDGWHYNHQGQDPTLEQSLESIIYYAENDAYPESFFNTNPEGTK